MHGISAEGCTPALDALLRVELEAVMVEEWPGGKARVGGDNRRTNGKQCGLDASVELNCWATPLTSKRRMSEKKIEITIVGVGSEACENSVRLGNDGVKMHKTLLPV